jgi:hypothetical protein
VPGYDHPVPPGQKPFAIEGPRFKLASAQEFVLHLDPLFFDVINIKEVVHLMSEMRWNKLRNVIFHKLLDPVRHLRKALVTPIIVPLDDLDARSLFCLLFNPLGDFLIRGSGRDESFELLRCYFRKTEKEIIERTVEVVFAIGSGKSCCLFETLLNFFQFALGEARMGKPGMEFLDLGGATGADQDRGDLWLAQDPGHRELCQRLASAPGQRS